MSVSKKLVYLKTRENITFMSSEKKRRTGREKTVRREEKKSILYIT